MVRVEFSEMRFTWQKVNQILWICVSVNSGTVSSTVVRGTSMRDMMGEVIKASIVTLVAATPTPLMFFCAHTNAIVLPLSANQRLTGEIKVSWISKMTMFHERCRREVNMVFTFLNIVILPTSALHELARLRIQYPMTFMISNASMGLRSYCGVLEFSAEEGMCHIPIWMMNNLCIEEGSEIILRNMNLQKGTYVKI